MICIRLTLKSLRPSKIGVVVSLVIITIIFAVAIAIFTSKNLFPGFYAIISNILWLLFILSAGTLALRLVIALVKGPARNKYLLGLVILIGSAAIFINFISHFEYTRLVGGVALIQDGMAEIATVKSVGDDMVASKKEAVLSQTFIDKVKNRLSAASKKLTINLLDEDKLLDYTLAVDQWQFDMSLSMNVDTWNALFDEPHPFTINLSTAQAEDALKTSIEKVAEIKEFGDAAIARGDTETLRYIAAKLQAQEYWLHGISSSPDSGFLNFSFMNQAHASILPRHKNPKKRPWPESKRSPVCIKDTCLDRFSNALGTVIKSASAYAHTEPDATQQWDNAWKNIDPMIQGAGVAIGGVGIGAGEKVDPLSPKARAFVNECVASGGTTLGSNAVDISRVPTGESGYICGHSNPEGICWDFLTYSGGRYMGGNLGCPESNLVPQSSTVPESIPAPQSSPNAPVPNLGTPLCDDDIKLKLKQADALVKQLDPIVKQAEQLVKTCVPPPQGSNPCPQFNAMFQTNKEKLDQTKVQYENAKADVLKRCGFLP